MLIDNKDFEAIAALKHGHIGSAVVERVKNQSRAMHQMYMLSSGIITLLALKKMRIPRTDK